MSDRKSKPRRNKKKSKNPAPPRRRKAKTPRKFNSVRMGQRIGNMFGPAAGRVGAEAGRLFRQLTGFGDYKVNSNSIMSSSDRLPMFKTKTSGTRVCHREFLFDVVTSATPGLFKIQQVPIQPALLPAFPWLSASAEQYQEYSINGMVYEFKSNSYDALASTNTASGSVIMTTNYNPLDAPFTNKFQMEQSQFTCSCKPSRDMLHPIECAKAETPTNVLYTRPAPTGTGDLRLYDWGTFNIATVGMQGASVNIGELWVTYDITLLKPKLGEAVDISDHYLLPAPYSVPGGNAYYGTTAHPPTLTTGSDMGTTLVASDTLNYDTIVWPPGYTGNVMVIYTIQVPTVAAANLAAQYNAVLTGGATLFNAFSGLYPGNQLTGNFVYNQTGGVTWILALSIKNGGTYRLTGGTTSAAGTAADLMILALPSSFT